MAGGVGAADHSRILVPMRALLLLLAVSSPLAAQPSLDVLTFERVATRLTQPVAVTYAPGEPGRLYITEQQGLVRVWEDGVVREAPFLDIRGDVSCCGERGLLSIAFHPEYAANGRYFIYYINLARETVVAEGCNPEGARLCLEPLRTLLTIEQPFGNHNGGQLQFGDDGYLYIGTGDGGSSGDPNNAGQDLLNLLGKVLRIDVDNGDPYAVPDDNPFAFVDNAQPEIWHYGLRNPWRWSFDLETGDMFLGDVGQGAREEVSFAAAGEGGVNFGWRRMEGSLCFNPTTSCSDSSLRLPILEYGHDPGNCGGSITGGYRYRGFAMPEFRGVYFYGDFCTGRFYGGVETNGEWRQLPSRQTSFGISAFGEDENGELYVADYAGTLYRLMSPSVLRPAITGGGVVNAASFAPGAPVAPGSLISVFGTEFAPASASAPSLPLPTQLAGLELQANGAAIPLVFAGPEQANGQLPWEVSGEMASLVAVVGANTSASEGFLLADYAPGIFTVSGGAEGQAAALIGGTTLLAAPQSESPAARPIRAGETLSLFATGLGMVSNTPQTGAGSPSAPLAQVLGAVSLSIGGVAATIDFAGLAPNFTGLYQINATLMPGTPAGDAVPAVLSIESAMSNAATIAVGP